jgi:predicted RNA binding protein YcfA (HicA-like mRNA interferase family)
MNPFRALSGKQVVAALENHGFEVIRVRGSHQYLRHPDGRATVVPVHAGETIGRGLMAKILRDTELSHEQLVSPKVAP